MKEQADGESFRLLFVCTGNTCRSPLAEAIARHRLEELGWDHVEVRSAGASAGEGAPASGGAVTVAGRRGLDVSGHRTRALSPELVQWADLILAMGPGHLLRALELGGDGRTALLTAFAQGDEDSEPDPEGVPDPWGGDDSAYERTFDALEDLVAKALRRLEPILAP